MTLRKWFVLASSAALIAGAGACKNSGGPDSAGSSAAQGRRGDTLPRARGADAGSDMSTGSGAMGSPGGMSGSTGSTSGTTGSSSKGSDSSGTSGTTGSGSSNSGNNPSR